MRLLPATLILALAAAPAVRAQRSSRIEGEVMDSVGAKPVVGAVVTVIRTTPEPQTYLTATTDARGHFRVDSLEAGQYQVSFSSVFLESLGLTLPAQELTLAAGQQARVSLASPSSTTLRSAACLGTALRPGQGAIVGIVSDAATDKALAGATVAISWSDFTVDRARPLTPVMVEREGGVPVDSLGQYRLCGVPTESSVMLQVQYEGRAGNALRTLVHDSEGVVMLNLSLDRAASRPIALLDAAASDTSGVAPSSGSATVSGVVRAERGAPLADAEVRVVDAVGTTRTDANGRFSITGVPAGTQLLEVRHVGYLLGSQPVELRSGRAVRQDLTLSRIVTLDSIRIVAQRARYQEFESRLRAGSGSFLNQEQIEKKNVVETGDLLRGMPGFVVIGEGVSAKVKSTRGAKSILLSCEPNIVIDGMQHQDFNLVRPADIGGIESYSGPAGAPIQYDSACGVILIWTKKG